MRKFLILLILFPAMFYGAFVYGGQLKDTVIDNDLTMNTLGTIRFEGATDNDFETTQTVVDPTADRTITFPDATGTVALTSQADGTIDHGADVTGLGDNDHTQYVLTTAIDTYSELNTIVADQTLTHNGLIDTYSELNTIVADQTLTHNGLIDTFSEIDAIVADKSLVNLEDGGTFTGNVIANANLSIGNAATSSGVLTILEDTDAGSNFASFQVPALAANTVYTWPNNDGDVNQILSTNGSGVMDWVADSDSGAGTGDKDAVATAPILVDGGTNVDNVLVGVDGDVTWSLAANGITRALIADAAQADDIGFVIETPTDADDFLIWRANDAVTITSVDCIVEDATSAVVVIVECDSAGDNCGTSRFTESLTCDVGGQADDGLTETGVVAGAWMRAQVGTVTGTPGHVAVTVAFTYDD